MKQLPRSRWFGWVPLGALIPLALAGCATSPASAPPAEVTPMPVPPAPDMPVMAARPASRVPGIDLDTVRAGRFDNGKMWTFEYPPLEYFREAYGFAPDSAWFERARLGALRLPNCTASFVSPHGLVMTNHHCGRGSGTRVSRPGENILDNGFYAGSLAEERRVPGLYVDQMIAIEDVSAEVETRLRAATSQDERAQVGREVTTEIQERIANAYGGSAAGVVVQVIALWNGAKTSAYVFKRYTDVRLVMIPELQMGYFGGDSDNFTYPRYVLDVSFFRIYDDGQPLETENYFSWSERGVGEGDAVFVIGNPGSTSRLETVAQLEFRRDVQDKYLLDLLTSRVRALERFYDQYPEEGEAMDLRNTIFGLLNSEKLYTGRWAALNDPLIMAKRWDAERKFRMALERDPALNARYGGLLYRMEQIQLAKLEYKAEYGGFFGLTSGALSSAMLRRAFWAYRYLTQRDAGASAEDLEMLASRMHAVRQQPRALQELLLTARLRDLERYFGRQIEMVAGVLQGRTARDAARAILSGSVLTDSASAADHLRSGAISLDDPAVQLAGAVIDRYETYQRAFAALRQQEQDVARSLGRARFEVYGLTIPPDATFSLRVADGVVKGYEYNGTVAPVFTTFYGLYDHFYSYGAESEWDLPQRWLDPPATFDLSTPLNFVSTADIIGGNSGSPVLNSDLEVVGLVFDGNIESLPGDYIYLPEKNRAVAVDARGILEAVDEIYDADRIVLELTAGRLVSTEAEADRALRRR